MSSSTARFYGLALVAIAAASTTWLIARRRVLWNDDFSIWFWEEINSENSVENYETSEWITENRKNLEKPNWLGRRECFLLFFPLFAALETFGLCTFLCLPPRFLWGTHSHSQQSEQSLSEQSQSELSLSEESVTVHDDSENDEDEVDDEDELSAQHFLFLRFLFVTRDFVGAIVSI